jgi:cytochrome o ubiquinol oxidase subunit 1
MTVTETPPEAITEASEAAATAADRPVASGGLAGIVGSGDHKVIGRLYIGFSLLFGLAALAAGLVVSIDRIDGTFGNTILTKDTWNQVLTFQSTAIVFLFLLPLIVGIALVVVPLQVGSPSVAFPRAAAASFWTWLIGSAMFVVAYLVNGGPGGGDFRGVGLWAASFAVLLAGLVLAAICLVTTVMALRAEGMSLDRTPLFAWSVLTGGTVWILSLPVLIGTLALIYVDHRYGQKSFGLNSPEMFDRVAWALRQPELYAFAAPGLGFIADVVPVAARHRPRRRQVSMGAIAAFSVLGFGAFAQATIYHRVNISPVAWGMAILAIFPVLALLGGLADTLKNGRPRIISPLVFAIGSALLLLLAVLAGATDSIQRFDLQGTLFELGHANLTEFAAVTAAIGALFYWATKIAGRALPAGAGMLSALLLLVGTLLASVPYAISGAFGSTHETTAGIKGLNGLAAAGYAAVLAGVLIAVLAVLAPSKGTAPDDPWEGHTLEWATSSPPTYDNFAEAQTVGSPEPLLDQQEAQS